MNDSVRGLVLWILAAVGCLFLYSGIKNVSPRSLVGSFVNTSAPTTPITAATTAATATTTPPVSIT